MTALPSYETPWPLITVDDFFGMVGDALASARVESIAQLWETPAFLVTDATVRPMRTREEISCFWAAHVRRDHARGMVDLVAEVEEEHGLGDRLLSVTVRWSHFDARREVLGSELSTWVLRVTETGAYRICAAVLTEAQLPR